MEEKKYLNEEKYQKTKGKILALAVVVLILALLIGGGLIFTGISKMSQVSKTTEATRTVEDIQEEIDKLKEEEASLNAKQNEVFKKDGFSEEYYSLENELEKNSKKVADLESQQFDMEHDDINWDKAKYAPFLMIGGFICLSGCMIAFSIFMFAKRREILAFQAQQVVPVGKEVIEDVAPTAGNFAKEISKGIKEGLNEADATDEK